MTGMDVEEAIRRRASVRSYGSAKVSDADIRELLELAAQAPSAGNMQEWVFVVAKKAETRAALAEAAFGRKMDCPVVVVVFADMEKVERAYGERGVSLYAAQDTAAAAENLMLAAAGRGIASCWIGSFNEQKVRDAVAAPQGLRPMALVTLGYAKGSPARTPRKSLSEFAFLDVYGRSL